MGGPGSSRWNDHEKRRTAEDCIYLDVCHLVREGAISPHHTHTSRVQWSLRGRQVAEALLHTKTRATMGHVVLLYTAYGTEVQDIIRLATTRPYFGGVRWWFTCPGCNRRVGRLYLPPHEQHFRCRCCYGLAYASAQQHDKAQDGRNGAKCSEK